MKWKPASRRSGSHAWDRYPQGHWVNLGLAGSENESFRNGGMRYTYEPINNTNGAEIIVRRFIGRLTRVMDEEALRDAGGHDPLPVIYVD
jgi:hypothetical protein